MSGPGLFDAFGVEIEYMIVDRDTLAVKPIADELLRAAAGSIVSEVEQGELSWSNELVLHVIELKTNGPAPTLEPLPGLFAEHVRRIDALLEPLGARLMPTGMHPWMDPETETRLWPHEYNVVYEAFDRIFGCRGHGWSNLQSVHLNLPFSGDEEFGRLHAAIRLALPLLPALAASSPLQDGRPTRVLDNRLENYRNNARRVPAVSGRVVPERAFSRAEYEERILQPLYGDLKMHDPEGVLWYEWVNARGAIARFDRDTIEIRLLDTQECPKADLAICAAVVAVVRALADERWSSQAEQRDWAETDLAPLLLETIRAGEQAPIGDARFLRTFGRDGAMTAGELWGSLSDELLAGTPWHATLSSIVRKGTLARRILRAIGTGAGAERQADVYRELCDCLLGNRLFDA